ncbi:MAG: hypothetical protein ABI707_10075 [Ferruginibacter sp.]
MIKQKINTREKGFIEHRIVSMPASFSKNIQDAITSSWNLYDTIAGTYSKKDTLQKKMLQQYPKPGICKRNSSLYSNKGYWGTSNGFSKLATKTPMQPCLFNICKVAQKCIWLLPF